MPYTEFGSGDEADAESGRGGIALANNGARVGERLRAIRRQKGLSLHDVEARSSLEFKASVLGAYERGERAISVPRLIRLAEIYEVPADQLLPREIEGEISLIETGAANGLDPNAKFTIDLVRLHELDDPDAHILDRFATSLQRERQDFNGRMLTIRRSDLRVLASCMGRSLDELGTRLEQLGLRAAVRLTRRRPAGSHVRARNDRTGNGPPPGSTTLARTLARSHAVSTASGTATSGTPAARKPGQDASVKILVPGNHLMVGLLGQRDELLRLVEAEFDVQILVRGNEINITGNGDEVELVGRLFEEMVVLLEQGHELDRENIGRSIEMMHADQRPTDVLTTEVVRGRKTIRPKTAGQKRYVDAVRDNTVTFAIGPAGTGKSYLAVALAVQALQAKEVNRIILTRPAVEAGERLGFLPGDMLQKVDPYLRPLYDALYDMVEPEVVVRLMERGTIEVAPLAYMRGRTLNDSFIILDEAQNTTPEQMKMFLTRLGFGSKVVVTGDVTQIDLPEGRGRSGLMQVRPVLEGIDGLVFVELGSSDVVRHRIVQDIVDAYERNQK